MTDTAAEIIADGLAVRFNMDGHGTDAHSSDLAACALAALIAHATPDSSGTRRVVIQQTEGQPAELVGLVEVGCWSCPAHGHSAKNNRCCERAVSNRRLSPLSDEAET